MLKSNENRIIQIISYNELIIEAIEKEIPNINYDITNMHQKLMIALFLTIIEIAKSINILLKNLAHISIPMLIRNMLEAYVDLNNLIKDQDYKFVMYSSYLKEQKRFLENNKIYPEMLKDVKDLLKNINITNDEIKFISRFKEAGLQKIYISLYNKLCRETHNNINCLVERYFVFEEGKVTLKYWSECRIDKICFLSKPATKFLIHLFLNYLNFTILNNQLLIPK